MMKKETPLLHCRINRSEARGIEAWRLELAATIAHGADFRGVLVLGQIAQVHDGAECDAHSDILFGLSDRTEPAACIAGALVGVVIVVGHARSSPRGSYSPGGM